MLITRNYDMIYYVIFTFSIFMNISSNLLLTISLKRNDSESQLEEILLEIGKPLPNRKTILLSSTLHYEADNCTTVSSLQEAIELADGKDLYVSGGYLVYKEALPLADRLYITVIDTEIEGDTYFPEFNEEDYIKTFEENMKERLIILITLM